MTRRRFLPVVALSVILLSGCTVTYPSTPQPGSDDAPVVPSSAPAVPAEGETGVDTNSGAAPVVASGAVDLTGFDQGYVSVLLAPGSTTSFTGAGALQIIASEGVEATPSDDGSVVVLAPDMEPSSGCYLILIDPERGEIEISIKIGEPQ